MLTGARTSHNEIILGGGLQHQRPLSRDQLGQANSLCQQAGGCRRGIVNSISYAGKLSFAHSPFISEQLHPSRQEKAIWLSGEFNHTAAIQKPLNALTAIVPSLPGKRHFFKHMALYLSSCLSDIKTECWS